MSRTLCSHSTYTHLYRINDDKKDIRCIGVWFVDDLGE